MIEKITEKTLEIINTTDMLAKRLVIFTCYEYNGFSIQIKFKFTEKGDLFFYYRLTNISREIIDEEPVMILKREKIKEGLELLFIRNSIPF